MTYSIFLSLCVDAAECHSFEQFCAECGGACPPECFSEDAKEDTTINFLQFCWDYSLNRSFQTVHHLSGLSQAAFSISYQIPIRSIEDWLRGIRMPPAYVVDLLAFAVCCNTVFREI